MKTVSWRRHSGEALEITETHPSFVRGPQFECEQCVAAHLYRWRVCLVVVISLDQQCKENLKT